MTKIRKKKPGRPIGYRSDNPHSERLAVNVTPDQLQAYKKSALKSGKSFSAWVRGVLDKASK